MTSLIIIRINFVCFEEGDVGGSRVKLQAISRVGSHDHRSCDYGITVCLINCFWLC